MHHTPIRGVLALDKTRIMHLRTSLSPSRRLSRIPFGSRFRTFPVNCSLAPNNSMPSGQTLYWVSEVLNPGDVAMMETLNELSGEWCAFLEKKLGVNLRRDNLDGRAYREARVKGTAI